MAIVSVRLSVRLRFKWLFVALAAPLVMLGIRVPDALIKPFVKVRVDG